MKNFISILLLLVVNLSFAQNSDTLNEGNNKESKIRLSPFFSYDFNLSDEIITEYASTTEINYNRFNYKVGVDIEYKVGSFFSIGSGLNYSQKRFSAFSYCPTCDFLDDDLQFDMGFVEIPLIGIYTYMINDLEVFGQLGIINHFNFSLNIFDDNNGISLNNIDTYSLSGKVGLGASYPIFGRHRLFLAADYSTGFTDVFENVDYKLKTLGIRMGIQFIL